MTNNIDSTPLHNLLAAQRWQEADVETRRIMLAIAGADKRDNLLLTQQDIENFPCSHLITINRLWTLHSENRFGFSVVCRIYEEAGGDYSQLARRVGWYAGDRWLNYNELTFDKTAPVGHLPVTWLVPATFWMYWQARFARVGWELLLSRWQTCENSEPETIPILEWIPPNPPWEGGNSRSSPSQGGKSRSTPSQGGKSRSTPSQGGNSRSSPSQGGKSGSTPSQGGNSGSPPSQGGKSRSPPSQGG